MYLDLYVLCLVDEHLTMCGHVQLIAKVANNEVCHNIKLGRAELKCLEVVRADPPSRAGSRREHSHLEANVLGHDRA